MASFGRQDLQTLARLLNDSRANSQHQTRLGGWRSPTVNVQFSFDAVDAIRQLLDIAIQANI